MKMCLCIHNTYFPHFFLQITWYISSNSLIRVPLPYSHELVYIVGKQTETCSDSRERHWNLVKLFWGEIKPPLSLILREVESVCHNHLLSYSTDESLAPQPLWGARPTRLSHKALMKGQRELWVCVFVQERTFSGLV